MKRITTILYKLLVVVGSLLFVSLSVYLIFHIAFIFGHRVLEGGILGGDTPYHTALMYALNKFYPEIPIWFPFAGAGSSLILGYWSFSYYLAIIGSHVFPFSIEQMVRILEFSATPLTAFTIYIYIWVRMKNQFQALMGALLYFLSSMSWGWIAHAGFFSMHMSVMLYLPTFLFYDLYIESEFVGGSVTKKRLYLLAAVFFVGLGMLVHGSFIPNLYLGIPLYTLIRSQMGPRINESRLRSVARAIKVTVIFTLYGLIASAYILIPQQSYFGNQPFTPVYGAADTPDLPWRSFLGFERLSGRVGSLYTPLFMSQLVSVLAIGGILMSFIRRSKTIALSITTVFYVWWLSAAKYLALNYEFLQFFLLPTATRASSVTALFITILAAYGVWELADGVRTIARWGARRLKAKPVTAEGIRYGLLPLSVALSSVVVYTLMPVFKTRQTFPTELGAWGIVEPYSGYGSLGFEIPFCKLDRWNDEVSELMTCNDYMPQYVVDHSNADFWTAEFTEDFNSLDIDKNTRVSISPYLGWMTFSFTRHSDASMVSAPSGQSIINLEWLGIHDTSLFLDGLSTADEVEEIAKMHGVRYAFFDIGTSERIWNRYPEDTWKTVMDSGGVRIKEFTETPGIISVSDRPRVLVISSEEFSGYDLVVQAAAKGMLSFDDAILIDAQTERLDSYGLEDLQQYDMILLRGYTYKNAKIWNTIASYVENGGNLFVDTGWQYVDRDWGIGPDAAGNYEEKELPLPFPVSATTWGTIGPTWNGYTLQSERSLKLANMGLPQWGDIGWGAAVARPENVREWATPVLSSDTEIILAKGMYGKGKVVWSGMNLMAHAFDKSSEGEYALLSEMMNYLLGEKKVSYANATISWDNPDSVVVEYSNAQPKSTLYLASTYVPQWRAFYQRNGKMKELSVLRSGPGYQAVHIPEDGNGTLYLKLDYSRLFFVSFVISGMLIVCLIISVLDSRYWNRRIEKSLRLFVPMKVTFPQKKVLGNNEHDIY